MRAVLAAGRPKSVSLAAILIFLSYIPLLALFAVAVFVVLIVGFGFRAMSMSDLVSGLFLIAFLAFQLAIPLQILRGRNWARLVYLGETAFGACAVVALLILQGGTLPAVRVIGCVVSSLLSLFTMYLLMKRDVAAWFKRDMGTFNEAQKARIENAGVLTAAGLIAGEALCGLVVAGFRAWEKNRSTPAHKVHILPVWNWAGADWLGLAVLVAVGAFMILLPLKNAGRPDEPAPPTAIM